jgi:plastocyanin
MAPRQRLRLALAATAALLLVGFIAVPAGAADRTVRIVSSDFARDPVRITVGDRVTWVNADSLPHDASGNGWSTPLLLNGQRASVRFNTRGTYRYTCTIHPEMSGRVIVSAPAVPAASRATPPPPAQVTPLPASKPPTQATGVALLRMRALR